MRNGRNAIAALALTLMFSAPAFAGIMVTDVAPPPPPPQATGIMVAEAADGVIQTGAVASTSDATDTGTEIALHLLQSVLTLF